VYLATPAVLKAVVGFDFHRGCVALGVRGTEPSVDDVLAGTPRRLVLVEDVSNPDTWVWRAASGARARRRRRPCCRRRAAIRCTAKAIRVSVGAALLLPWARVTDWDAALARVRAAGFTLIALHPHDGGRTSPRWPCPPARSCCSGQRAPDSAPRRGRPPTVTVRIPMAVGVDSLNVATACAIALERMGGARR